MSRSWALIPLLLSGTIATPMLGALNLSTLVQIYRAHAALIAGQLSACLGADTLHTYYRGYLIFLSRFQIVYGESGRKHACTTVITALCRHARFHDGDGEAPARTTRQGFVLASV
jgi:hypothetical protein